MSLPSLFRRLVEISTSTAWLKSHSMISLAKGAAPAGLPTRLALNYKNLSYATQWLEYPAVAPTLQSFGLDSNPTGIPYTVPTVRFPDGTVIMDSRKIAAELESRYPSPPLHLDSEILPKVEELIINCQGNARGLLLPKVPRNLLNEASRGFFEDTRREKFGKSLEDLEEDEGGEKAWKGLTPHLHGVGDLLRANGGPFVLGKEVSYADFPLVGFLQFMKKIEEDIYERAVRIEPALKSLYEASAGCLKRDDH